MKNVLLWIIAILALIAGVVALIFTFNGGSIAEGKSPVSTTTLQKQVTALETTVKNINDRVNPGKEVPAQTKQARICVWTKGNNLKKKAKEVKEYEEKRMATEMEYIESALKFEAELMTAEMTNISERAYNVKEKEKKLHDAIIPPISFLSKIQITGIPSSMVVKMDQINNPLFACAGSQKVVGPDGKTRVKPCNNRKLDDDDLATMLDRTTIDKMKKERPDVIIDICKKLEEITKSAISVR